MATSFNRVVLPAFGGAVAFSFYDLGLNREDVEFYTHGGMLTAHQPSRLMLVTDRQMTLTADCGAFANWSGTVSNNGLMVKILSEHIQHDITLLQLHLPRSLLPHREFCLAVRSSYAKSSVNIPADKVLVNFLSVLATV